MLPRTITSPYARPIFATGVIREEPESSSPPPGVPEKMVLEPVSVVVGAPLVEVEVVLYRLGLLAPQGLSWRQADEHWLFCPHAVTHWLPYSWQMKYGRVREYSETLGCLLLPQRQPNVRVSGLHSLTRGGPGLSCEQMRGQVLTSSEHQDCLVLRGTLSGSM